MKHIILMMLCGLFTLTAGCAPLYAPPSGGQTAKITHAGGIYTNPRLCTGYQYFPYSLLDLGSPPVVTIPANQLTTLKLFYNTTKGSTISGCDLIVSFHPVANHTYDVEKTLQDQSFFRNFVHAPDCIFTIVDKTTNKNVLATQRNGNYDSCNDNMSHGQNGQPMATRFTVPQRRM